jgi:PEP-CTERM motif
LSHYRGQKSFFAASALAITLMLPLAGQAQPGNGVWREIQTIVLPPTPAGVNDVHIKFKNDEPWAYSPFGGDEIPKAGFLQVSPHGPEADFSGQVDWGGGSPPEGGRLQLTIPIITKSQHFTPLEGTWTFKASGPQPIDGFAKLKFQGTVVGDPMIDFWLTNDDDNYLLLTNVATLSNTPELPLDAPVGSVPGFVDLWSSLLLAPGEESPHFISPNVDPGHFLYVKLDAYVSDAVGNILSGGIGYQWGHEVETVPEPSTWAMIVVGFFGLAFASRRGRLQPQPERPKVKQVGV